MAVRLTAGAVLFDLDGTLADTLDDITSALNATFAGVALAPRTREETVAWVGWGVRYLVEHAVPPDRAGEVDAIVARFREIYARDLIRTTAPYPGVPALLDGLVDRGVPIAVLSNKPHEMTLRIVREVFGRWSFAGAFGARTGVPIKPDPTAALELAAALGEAPADCVFVGDTAVDVETAARAGMVPVAVSWGFRSADELAAAGAAYVAPSADALADWLRRAASAVTES